MIEQENVPYTADEIKAMVKTIEELRKKYNDALDRAKILIDKLEDNHIKGFIYHIFPELLESQDERIRKTLIKYIKGIKSWNYFLGISKDQMIAWLEKQGEKPQGKTALEAAKEEKVDNQNCVNPADNVEPKFKVGDIVQYITDSTDRRKIEEIDTLCNMYHTDSSPIMFEIENEWKVVVNAEDVEQEPVDKVESKFHEGEWVVYDHRPYQVVELPKEGYINLGLRRNGKVEFAPSPYCRHWDIQDAKDGDVLVDVYGNIGIYKSHDDFDWTSYCSLGCNGGFQNFKVEHENEKTYPTTKEQRDTLIKAMANAGYTFDFEKKELKKIETKTLDAAKVVEWLEDKDLLINSKKISDYD